MGSNLGDKFDLFRRSDTHPSFLLEVCSSRRHLQSTGKDISDPDFSHSPAPYMAVTAASFQIINRVGALGAVALATLLLGYVVLGQYTAEASIFSPSSIHRLPEWIHHVTFGAGVLSLFSICILGFPSLHRQQIIQKGAEVLLVSSVMVQSTLVLRHGTWTQPDTPTKSIQQMDEEKRKIFKLYNLAGAGMESTAVIEQLTHSFMEPHAAMLYRKVHSVEDRKDMWSWLAQHRTPQQAVVEASTENRLEGTYRSSDDNDLVRLTHATYNVVQFDVTAQEDVLLATNIPYSPLWSASLSGTPLRTYRTNGNVLGCFVPKGTHEVSIQYNSHATYVGAIISAATLLILGAFLSYKTLRGRARIIVCALTFVLPVLGFTRLTHSFHHGQPMPADYTWSSSEFPPQENKAFGKQTSSSSNFNDQMPYFNHPSRAVDGLNNVHGFSPRTDDASPWWQVDLGHVEEIDYLMIYQQGLQAQNFPIIFNSSFDGNHFEYAGHINTPLAGQAWKLGFQGKQARFLRIQISHPGNFTLNEVEVYTIQRPEHDAVHGSSDDL